MTASSIARRDDGALSFSLLEHEEARWPLEADLARQLAESKLVDVVRRPADSDFTVSASSNIGIAVGAGWELRVLPKCPVGNLLHLLGFTTDSGWGDTAAASDEDDFASAVAHGFVHHANRATARGLLHGYVWIDDDLTSPRGRVDFARQAASRAGVPLPMAVRYEDYSPDIAENRLLKSASLRLEALGALPATVRNAVQHLTDRLADASAEPSSDVPPITRLNAHYAQAMRIAWLINRGLSTSQRAGAAPSTTFIFDMNRVFEEFVTTGLASRLRRRGGATRFRSASNTVRTVSLDEAGAVLMEPDFTWLSAGTPLAVLDVKYKRSPSPGDYYQALAYGIALELPDMHLVLPGHASSGTSITTLVSKGRRIHVHRVAIDGPPREIEAGLDDVAARVAAVAANGSPDRVG